MINRGACGAVKNLAQLVGLGRAHHDFEQEPVHLSLRQRIRSYQLDGILRGEYEEWWFKQISLAEYGDLPLLHRFEDCRLRFGSGPIDFVSEHDVGENRTGFEAEFPPAVSFGENLCADNVRRHKVGSELNALKAQPERFGRSLDHQGLAEPGHAFDQNMTTRHQGGQ